MLHIFAGHVSHLSLSCFLSQFLLICLLTIMLPRTYVCNIAPIFARAVRDTIFLFL